MNTLTYIEARDKIWNAYFRDEIKPCAPEFCFCGTLEGGYNWLFEDKAINYSVKQYGEMERALFSHFPNIIWQKPGGLINQLEGGWLDDIFRLRNYEELLFSGMLAALEVLKQIHRERGEPIPEDEPLLTKRNLEGEIKN